MTLRQLQLMHAGAVEQRWGEVAWLCHVLVNSQRTSDRDPVHAPTEFNPLRLAEKKSGPPGPGGEAPGTGPTRRGGMPLDRETIRAYHTALRAREARRRAPVTSPPGRGRPLRAGRGSGECDGR